MKTKLRKILTALLAAEIILGTAAALPPDEPAPDTELIQQEEAEEKNEDKPQCDDDKDGKLEN